MFPGPGADIYRNEAGEVLGWDYPSYEPDEEDFEDAERRWATAQCEICEGHPDDCDRCVDCETCVSAADWLLAGRCATCYEKHTDREKKVWLIRRFSKRGEHDF